MSRVARVVLTCATAPAQVLAGFSAGLLLSRLARGSASGWGDLIGMVAGILLGPGLALAVLVFLASRVARRPVLSVLVRTVAVLPSPFLAVLLTRLTPLGFPVAACLYLCLSTAAVWWASRPAPAARLPASGTMSQRRGA